jgi:NADPH-dependent glutamate synthase beta subunit-like oxidoreductase
MGNQEKVEIGNRAAVIGGGNTAIDCVRTLIRMGVEKVYLVYRRTRKEMPANEVEIVAAEHEGVEFVFLAAPNKVVGDDEGNVSGLEYLKMELGEPDASGRRRPVPVEGSETVLDVDMIITAIGQSPDTAFRTPGTRMDELNITRWDTIDVNPDTCQTNVPYIFAAGDGATGPALVVDAIGGGRRAESIFSSVEGVGKTRRAPMPELPVQERIRSFVEADLVLPEADALAEANRCLDCCRLCYNPDKIKESIDTLNPL